MADRRFQDIWKDQCVAAADVKAKYGLSVALDYLVGEKLLSFVEAAGTRPEFARELPAFVAEIRRIFARDDLEVYFEMMSQRAGVPDKGHIDKKFEESGLLEGVARKKARVEKLNVLKPLLLAEMLGTG